MQVAKIQAVLVADTRQFDADLATSRRTIEAFAPVAQKQIERLKKSFDALKAATGMSDEAFNALKSSMRDSAAISAAGKALDRLAKSGAVTETQLKSLSTSMGFKGNSSLAERFVADAAAATGLTRAVDLLKTVVVGYAGINMLKDVARTAVDLASIQKTFYALTGSTAGARAEMAWLREEAQRLGQDFFALAESFKGFSAAGKSAGISTSQVREIFTAVSESATVLGLNGQKTQLALYALEQMLSKGVVSMEELRRQLGDQLPGAFQVAAKAMDMDTRALSKLVESGKLVSTEFLPKFAKALREEYGHGLAEAVKTPRAELQRLNNAITFSKQIIGDGGFLQGLSGAAKDITASLSSESSRAGLTQFGKTLGSLVGVLAKLATFGIENGRGILSLGVGITTVTVGARIFQSVLGGLTGTLAQLGVATTVQTTKNMALAASFKAAYSAQGKMGLAKGLGGALLGAVGGPWTVALTAAAAGITYLATRQTEAEKVASLYGDTMEEVRARLIKVKAAAEGAGEAVNYAAKNKARDSLSSQLESLETIKNKTASLDIYGYSWLSRTFSPDWIKSTIADLESMRAQFVNNKISFEEYAASLDDIRKKVETGGGNETKGLLKTIDSLYRSGEAIEALNIQIDGNRKIVDGISLSFRDVADCIREALAEVEKFGTSLRTLDASKIASVTDGLLFDLSQSTRTDPAKAMASLFKQKLELDTSDIDEQGFVTATAYSRMDEAAKRAVNSVTMLNSVLQVGTIISKSQKPRRSGSGASPSDRPALQLSKSYDDATNSLEQFRLKREQLTAELAGNSFEATGLKLLRDYKTQIGKVNGQINSIKGNLTLWQKQGKANSEVATEAQKTLTALENQKAVLSDIYNLEKERAVLNERIATAQAMAERSKLQGNAQGSYQAEIGLLQIELQRTSNLEKRALVMEQMRRLTARKDGDAGGLLQSGFQDQSFHAWEDYADFFEKDLPGSFTTASNALGDMVGNMLTGSTSIGDAWSNLGKTLQSTLAQLASDLFSTYVRLVAFGTLMKSFGFAGGGGSNMTLGSMATSAIGGATSVDSIVQGFATHHSGGIIGKGRSARVLCPAAFADALRFHTGGVVGLRPNEVPIIGLRGEEVLTESDPRHRNNLSPTGAGAYKASPTINMPVHIENHTSAQVHTSTTQDSAGNPLLNIQIVEQLENGLAQRIYSGRSSIGQAMDRTRGSSTARHLYNK